MLLRKYIYCCNYFQQQHFPSLHRIGCENLKVGTQRNEFWREMLYVWASYVLTKQMR